MQHKYTANVTTLQVKLKYSQIHHFPSFYLAKYCAMHTLKIVIYFLFLSHNRYFHSSSFKEHLKVQEAALNIQQNANY